MGNERLLLGNERLLLGIMRVFGFLGFSFFVAGGFSDAVGRGVPVGVSKISKLATEPKQPKIRAAKTVFLANGSTSWCKISVP